MALFDPTGPIAGIIARAFSSLTPAATLTKITPGTRDIDDLAAGTEPTSTSYAAKGVVEKYEAKFIGTLGSDGSIIERNDRRVLLFGASIASGAIPQVGDTVTILGVTYNIVGVEADPVSATFSCQSRG